MRVRQSPEVTQEGFDRLATFSTQLEERFLELLPTCLFPIDQEAFTALGYAWVRFFQEKQAVQVRAHQAIEANETHKVPNLFLNHLGAFGRDGEWPEGFPV